MQQNFSNNYVVGRGTVYFDQFKKGSNKKTGELYFGNTPEFTISTDSETLDHYNSDHGLRVMDASVLLEASVSGTFTCDNINAENLALWFLGDVVTSVQTKQTDAVDVYPSVTRGRYYQLGTTDTNPTGVRNVDKVVIVSASPDVSISTGTGSITDIPGVKVVPATDYEVDLELGRIYVEMDAKELAGNVQMAVQYDVAATKRTMVIGKSNMVYGSLRMISDNPVGENKNYFFPKVSLAPDGDYALKGDDWQVMSFSYKAMQLNTRTQRVYIDIVGSVDAADPKKERNATITLDKTTATTAGTIAATVLVKDGNGDPVASETVNFSGVSALQISASEVSTSQTGEAKVNLSSTTAGTYSVTATLANGKAIQSETFTITEP